MKELSPGVVTSSVTGYLSLTPEALDELMTHDPIAEYYDMEETPFARGKFATVRRARCKSTGRWFAAKAMRKRRRAQDVRHEIIHEAAILVLARDFPTIVQLHQIYESASEIVLMLELATGGELQRVVDEEQCLEEQSVRLYIGHVLNAIKFLHSYNIAHLDIKPQNILLTDEHPNSEVRLCDFGISRIILADIEVREVLGTPDYVAPEILQYEPICLATDMWSVGVLAYVLLSGCSPFGGDTKQETFLNISQGEVDFPEELFASVSSEACDFISRLLIVSPSARLTVDKALRHPWLSGCIASPPPPSSVFCSSVVSCISPRCPSPDPLVNESIQPLITNVKSQIEPVSIDLQERIKPEIVRPPKSRQITPTTSTSLKSTKSPSRRKVVSPKTSESSMDSKSPSTPQASPGARVSRFKKRSVERSAGKESPSSISASNTRFGATAKRGTDSTDSSPHSAKSPVSPKSRAAKRLAESTEKKVETSRTPPLTKPRTLLNKENNRNIINSHRRELVSAQKSPSTKSPTPTYHRRTRLEAPPGSTSAKREEYLKKVGKQTPETFRKLPSSPRSKEARKSPSSNLRVGNSKCNTVVQSETPNDSSQRKYNNIILDKGVMC